MTRAATFRSRIMPSRWRTRSKSPHIRVSASRLAIKSCTDRVALFHVIGDPVARVAVGDCRIARMVLARCLLRHQKRQIGVSPDKGITYHPERIQDDGDGETDKSRLAKHNEIKCAGRVLDAHHRVFARRYTAAEIFHERPERKETQGSKEERSQDRRHRKCLFSNLADASMRGGNHRWLVVRRDEGVQCRYARHDVAPIPDMRSPSQRDAPELCKNQSPQSEGVGNAGCPPHPQME